MSRASGSNHPHSISVLKLNRYLPAALCTCVLALPAPAPAQSFQDIGPNYADGKDDSWRASSSGLIYKISGDANTLYAVSLNAGIWKRHIHEQWLQLPASSGLTTTLEIDPTSPRHLVSGDRNNDASQSDPSRFDLSLSGIHESFDGGDTWQLAFSAAAGMASTAAPAPCANIQSQAIPAIAITPTGTILAATGCGIVRKTHGGGLFNWSSTPPDLGAVSALSISRVDSATTLIWAVGRRSSVNALALLLSTDDGATWSFKDIPPNIAAGLAPDFDGTGDTFSLASFDRTALMVFKHLLNPDTDNRSWLLYFDSVTGQFSTQIPDNANNGTGLGGRRSFRTTVVAPPFKVGKGLRIVFNAGQNVLEGTGLDNAGHIKWKHVVNTYCAGCNNTNHVHADLWDVLPTMNPQELFVAGDGGIYSKEGSTFKSYNDGLHTQHINTLTLLESNGAAVGPGIAYATSDNDAWFWDGASPAAAPSKWKSYKGLGDANWTDGDRGNRVLALEILHGDYAQITDFAHPAPAFTHHVGGNHFGLSCSRVIDPKTGKQSCGDAGLKPRNFFVLQSPLNTGGATVNADLDVIWLTSPPLQFKKGNLITDLSTGTLADGIKGIHSPVLLRNFALALQPAINDSRFKGWTLESGNLPAGATRVWGSTPPGSSALATLKPTYYVCACDGDLHKLPPQLFVRPSGSTVWSKVQVNIPNGTGVKSLDILAPIDDSAPTADLEVGGPLFVDPLDPSRLVLLTTDGVVLSNDGGVTWTSDTVLNALLTDSGQYPLANGFPSGNSSNVAQGTRGLAFMYVSSVDFGRGTGELAVASPFTGVFFRAAVGQPWLNATALLPKPLPTASTIALSGHEAFIGLEGRSLIKTQGLTSARLAAWYRFPPAVIGRQSVPPTQLMGADNAPIASVPVTVTFINPDGTLMTQSITTDATGEIPLPASAGPLARVFFSFAGTSHYAPASTAFRN